MASILVAEDEPSVRTFLRRALLEAGHRVDTVEDGSEALEALRTATASGTPYDLLLADILMPVMDGVTLALTIAGDKPRIPIVLMTGYSDQRERAHGLEAIVSEILLKPFTMAELLACIQTTLARPVG